MHRHLTPSRDPDTPKFSLLSVGQVSNVRHTKSTVKGALPLIATLSLKSGFDFKHGSDSETGRGVEGGLAAETRSVDRKGHS